VQSGFDLMKRFGNLWSIGWVRAAELPPEVLRVDCKRRELVDRVV
jgi:hypothetical protein